MVAQLRITARHAKNLAVIRDIGKQRLTAVLECLRALPKPPVSAKRFQRFIADTLEAEPDAAILTRVLVSLDIVSRQYHITPDEIVESLSEGLKQHQWTDEQTARWNESADVLRAMLALETTRVVAKAIDLSFDYAHLLDNARIITDIRPVFDERHTAIIGAVVSHVLRISYLPTTARAA